MAKIKEKVEFKFRKISYKCFHGITLSYLSELLVVMFNYESGCRSRSLLIVYLYDNRNIAFKVAAPILLNQLPSTIINLKITQIFKKKS